MGGSGAYLFEWEWTDVRNDGNWVPLKSTGSMTMAICSSAARTNYIAEEAMRCVSAMVFVGLISCTTLAEASTEYGLVNWVSIRASDGLIYFSLTSTNTILFPPPSRSARPACATQGYWVIRNETSAAGQMQYDALLRAKASSVPVIVIGAAACTRWPDGEDAETVQVGGIGP